MPERLPDMAAQWDDSRCLQEETTWILDAHYKRHLAFLRPRLERYRIASVIEVGCGSGLLANDLPAGLDYLGIDRCGWFVDRAKARAEASRVKGRAFKCWDARNMEAQPPYDLVMAWNFFKNFSLEEFPRLLAKVLSLGRLGCFNVQVAPQAFDNGSEFHHSFVMAGMVEKAVQAARCAIKEEETLGAWYLEGKGDCKDVVYWVEQMKATPGIEAIVRPEGTQTITETDSLSEALGHPTCKYQQSLTVGDLPVHDLHNYSLRWVQNGGSHEPVLYHQGKRVVEAWILEMSTGKMPEDKKGRSA